MSAVRELLTGEKVVAYYPQLARALGGINEALWLQQVAHWEGKSNDGWVFRTSEQMEQELVMTYKQQARVRTSLKKLGVLEEKREGIPARLYFRINWDKVEGLLKSLPLVNSVPAERSTLDHAKGKNYIYREESKYESKYENNPPIVPPVDEAPVDEELTDDDYMKLRDEFQREYEDLDGEIESFYLALKEKNKSGKISQRRVYEKVVKPIKESIEKGEIAVWAWRYGLGVAVDNNKVGGPGVQEPLAYAKKVAKNCTYTKAVKYFADIDAFEVA